MCQNQFRRRGVLSDEKAENFEIIRLYWCLWTRKLEPINFYTSLWVAMLCGAIGVALKGVWQLHSQYCNLKWSWWRREYQQATSCTCFDVRKRKDIGTRRDEKRKIQTIQRLQLSQSKREVTIQVQYCKEKCKWRIFEKKTEVCASRNRNQSGVLFDMRFEWRAV